MKPRDRKLRLRKSTLRDLTSELADNVRAGHDLNANTLYTCRTCQLGTGCGTTGNTCAETGAASCINTACC